jgi:hypothetical protein
MAAPACRPGSSASRSLGSNAGRARPVPGRPPASWHTAARRTHRPVMSRAAYGHNVANAGPQIDRHKGHPARESLAARVTRDVSAVIAPGGIFRLAFPHAAVNARHARCHGSWFARLAPGPDLLSARIAPRMLRFPPPGRCDSAAGSCDPAATMPVIGSG